MTSQSKRLFLLRHATSLPHATNGDINRELSPKGIDEAKSINKIMIDQGYTPDIILCSTATRTRQTLQELQKNVEVPNTIFIKELYNGDAGDYLYEIQQIEDKYKNILIIAHNPSIYELVILLAAQGHDSLMQRLSEGYRPATLSVIECKCKNWQDIKPAVNELSAMLDPLDYNVPAKPIK